MSTAGRPPGNLESTARAPGKASAKAEKARGTPAKAVRNSTKATNKNSKNEERVCSGALGSAQFGECMRTELAPVANGLRNPGCGGGPKAAGLHQRTVVVAARTLARGLGGASRGAIVYHNTGSGKSLVSLGIMIEYMLAGMEDPALARDIVLTTSVNNLKENSLKRYARNAIVFFPAKVPAILRAAGMDPQTPPAGAGAPLEDAVEAALRRRVRLQSFVQLAGALGGRGGMRERDRDMLWGGRGAAGSVVIMDEAQDVGTPGASSNTAFAAACRALNRILTDLTPDRQARVHLWALTATPGYSIASFLGLANLVRATGQRRLAWREGGDNSGLFRALRGLVFYADIRGDRSRHAVMTRHERPCPMPLDYYKCVLAVLASKPDRYGGAPDPLDPLRYMQRLREASGFLSYSLYAPVLKLKTPSEAVRRYGEAIVDMGEGRLPKLVAPKLLRCVKELVAREGKQYAYASFGLNINGAVAVVMALLRRHGFADATREASKLTGGKTFPPGRRFVVFGAPAMRGSDEDVASVRAAFNHVDNRGGTAIKIAIGVGEAFQGLDLYCLRGVHIMEPLPSMIADLQAEGRGVRTCSHVDLPMSKRTVDVVRWLSTAPAGAKITADLLEGPRGRGGAGKGFASALELLRSHGSDAPDVLANMQLAIPVVRQYRSFERVVKQLAVDCFLLNSFHDGIECGKLHRVPPLSELVARNASPVARNSSLRLLPSTNNRGNGGNIGNGASARTSARTSAIASVGAKNTPPTRSTAASPSPSRQTPGPGAGTRTPKSKRKGWLRRLIGDDDFIFGNRLPRRTPLSGPPSGGGAWTFGNRLPGR